MASHTVADPSEAGDLDPVVASGDLRELYRLMTLTRAAEERLETLQREGLMPGSVFRSLGQEAGAVGATWALRRREDGSGDRVAASLRGAGVLLTLGVPLRDYFAHHLGRAAGPTGGRESHLHWSDPERGLVGGIFPLGTLLEVMSGVALAFRMGGEDRVAMVFTGDGATSTGAWHEGLALGASQRCPLVVVVEHNRYAFSTPTEGNTRLDSFTDKAAAYGIGAASVDGTDVEAVVLGARAAVARARAGEGPQLLELRYFRRKGHAQHDAQEYVDPAEIAAWEARDPLRRLAGRMTEAGFATAEELAAMDADAREACRVAADEALAEPLPRGVEALGGVYTDVVPTPPWTRA